MHFKPQMKKFCCVSVMVLKTNVEGEIFFLSGFDKYSFPVTTEKILFLSLQASAIMTEHWDWQITVVWP